MRERDDGLGDCLLLLAFLKYTHLFLQLHPLLCFNLFRLVSEKEVLQVVEESSTSCDLDPIPIHLLKKILTELVPIPTIMLFMTFESGCIPDKYLPKGFLMDLC